MSRRHPAHILTVACALMAAGTTGVSIIAGCAGTQAPAGHDESGNVGVLMSTWIVPEPSGERVGRALREFDDRPIGSGPGFEAGVAKLRAAGLRPLLVPVAELPRVLSSLDAESDRHGSLLEQSPRWSVALSGAHWSGERAVRFNDGAVNLGPGRFRLLMRSWIAPGELLGDSPDPAFAAVVRVAMVLQHEEPPRRPDSPFALRPAQLRRIEDDGQIFASLSLEFTIARGQALVLVPELPDVDWSAIADGDPGPTSDPESEGAQALAGPPKAQIRSVGEYLLSDATDLRRWTRRTILVFTGQAPERYELLPRY
ncbi:MAG: hypothetical protein AABZ53_08855 [Planctomycetota bacterium]